MLQRKTLPREFDELLPTALRVSRYYSEAAELAASRSSEEPAISRL